MKAIGKLRNYVNNTEKITPEILEDLGFKEVLSGSWKLIEDIPSFDGYSSIVYVRYTEDKVVLLEASNIYGEVKIGNYYIDHSATVSDLLNAVELLKI